MTFKKRLQKLSKKALNKESRTKEEKKLINKFISERLIVAAHNGKRSAKFGINYLAETIVEPKSNKKITIRKSDYIKFAIRNFMRIKIVTNESFISQNYVLIFF